MTHYDAKSGHGNVRLAGAGAVQSEIWERSRTHAEAASSQTRPEQLALYRIQLEKLCDLTVKVSDERSSWIRS